MVIVFCSKLIYFWNPQKTTIVLLSCPHDFLLNINEDFMFVGSFRVSIFDYLRALSHVLSIPTMSWVVSGRILLQCVQTERNTRTFPVMRTFVFVSVSLNKLLNKQSSCHWFETPCSYDVTVMCWQSMNQSQIELKIKCHTTFRNNSFRFPAKWYPRQSNIVLIVVFGQKFTTFNMKNTLLFCWFIQEMCEQNENTKSSFKVIGISNYMDWL